MRELGCHIHIITKQSSASIALADFFANSLRCSSLRRYHDNGIVRAFGQATIYTRLRR